MSKKKTSIVITWILLLILIMNMGLSSVFAAENNYQSYCIEVDDLIQYNNTTNIELSNDKLKELNILATEMNLNDQDIDEIQKLYKEYHQYNQIEDSKIKAKIVKKVVKLIVPLTGKALKAAGVKVTEKGLADITNFLFEWEGPLQDGIEQALISIGAPKTVAHWSAKTIMFVLF
ncbi:hypothetical protein [Lachnospira multipara]|uniref:hypothetical protein n=1 Tax=Lachnospira multipara TaxID=28051 RepID=UPI0004E193F2|nr:hypothetical protein [Lachnospira multipara]